MAATMQNATGNGTRSADCVPQACMPEEGFVAKDCLEVAEDGPTTCAYLHNITGDASSLVLTDSCDPIVPRCRELGGAGNPTGEDVPELPVPGYPIHCLPEGCPVDNIIEPFVNATTGCGAGVPVPVPCHGLETTADLADLDLFDAVIVSDDTDILSAPWLVATGKTFTRWSEAMYTCIYPNDSIDSEGDPEPWGTDAEARAACGFSGMTPDGENPSITRDCTGLVPYEAGSPVGDDSEGSDATPNGPGAGSHEGKMYVWVFAADRGNTDQKPAGKCNLRDVKAGVKSLEEQVEKVHTGNAEFAVACILAKTSSQMAWHPYEPSGRDLSSEPGCGSAVDSGYGKTINTCILVNRLDRHLEREWNGLGETNNLFIGWVRTGNHNGEAFDTPSQLFVAAEKCAEPGVGVCADWPQPSIVRHEFGHSFGLTHYPNNEKVSDCGYWQNGFFHHYRSFMNYCYAYSHRNGSALTNREAETLANQFWS